MHLLPQRLLGASQACADLAGAHPEGGPHLHVAESAVAERQHGRRPSGEPGQRRAQQTSVLPLLRDLLRVERRRVVIPGLGPFAPLPPPPAAQPVERRVDRGAVQPCGGVGGVGPVPAVEVDEDLLGHVLGLGAIGEDAVGDGHHPAVLGEEEPIERSRLGLAVALGRALASWSQLGWLGVHIR